jgi:uncharacterized small protein (DUF1192 family)
MTDGGWKETTGVADSTAKVTLYCSKSDKEEWTREVDEKGYNSRSKYLYELVQEARAYREQGFLAHHESEEKIEELQQEIERLEDRLENQEKQSSGRTQVDDVDFLENFLEDTYKPLDQILREIVESGALNDLIRERVEDQLYFLAQQNRVEYERGHGWKLSQKQSGGEQ